MTKANKNIYRTDGPITYIDIMDGNDNLRATVLIDTSNIDLVKQCTWNISSSGHIINRGSNMSLHHLVYETDSMIDHIDRNPCNNLLSNLRATNKSLNAANMFRNKQNTSGFKGVCFNRRNNKWISQIKNNYKFQWLGSYDNIEDAAIAYDCAAIQIYGEHAMLNLL